MNRSSESRGSPTPREKRELEFLFDEHFSWKIVNALRIASYPFQHVQLVRELGIWDHGAALGRKARDEEIVPWANKHGFIVVTCDDDYRGAEFRRTLLVESRVEVIWFRKQPVGLQAQAEQIVRHYPKWVEILASEAPSYRQWMQPPYGNLKRMQR